MPPVAPEKLDGYILSECVSRGRLRELWKAHGDGEPDKPVLIIRPVDPDYAARWRTADIGVHRLDHSRILGTLSVYADHDPPFAIAEWFDGRPLRDILDQERTLSPDQAARMISKILGALEFAHSKGVVHRDLRPENVLVGEDDRVRILGFGLGAAAEPGEGGIGANAGALPASPYLAPEQCGAPSAEGAVPDRRSDVFAAGLILYEMITGEVQRLRFPMPSTPDWISSAVETATRPRPADRYESAAEMHAQLDGRMPAEARRLTKGRRRRRRHWNVEGKQAALLWIGGGVLLLGLGYAWLYYISPALFAKRPPPPDVELSHKNDLLYEDHGMRYWEQQLEIDASRHKAAEALAAFGPDAVPALVRGLARHDKDPDIVKALGLIGPAGLPAVEALANDRDLKVRQVVPMVRALMNAPGDKTKAPR